MTNDEETEDKDPGLEELVPDWTRCSAADLYYNKDLKVCGPYSQNIFNIYYGSHDGARTCYACNRREKGACFFPFDFNCHLLFPQSHLPLSFPVLSPLSLFPLSLGADTK